MNCRGQVGLEYLLLLAGALLVVSISILVLYSMGSISVGPVEVATTQISTQYSHFGGPPELIPELCANFSDDDGDSLTDCEDEDCVDDLDCMCADSSCDETDNCPALAITCVEPAVCLRSTCTDGCGIDEIDYGKEDSDGANKCESPNHCNGSGLCVTPEAPDDPPPEPEEPNCNVPLNFNDLECVVGGTTGLVATFGYNAGGSDFIRTNEPYFDFAADCGGDCLGYRVAFEEGPYDGLAYNIIHVTTCTFHILDTPKPCARLENFDGVPYTAMFFQPSALPFHILEPLSASPYCPDSDCEAGENCPADTTDCQDNSCYEPTCAAGCEETLVEAGLEDEACNETAGCAFPPCKCDGVGNCLSCGDNVCGTGEVCPADAVGCEPDRQCFEPTCTDGCGEILVNYGGTDEACYADTGCDGTDCFCNGIGGCISCGDGICSSNENCPADTTDCPEPGVCKESVSCTQGCQYTRVADNTQVINGPYACDDGQGCDTPPCHCVSGDCQERYFSCIGEINCYAIDDYETCNNVPYNICYGFGCFDDYHGNDGTWDCTRAGNYYLDTCSFAPNCGNDICDGLGNIDCSEASDADTCSRSIFGQNCAWFQDCVGSGACDQWDGNPLDCEAEPLCSISASCVGGLTGYSCSDLSDLEPEMCAAIEANTGNCTLYSGCTDGGTGLGSGNCSELTSFEACQASGCSPAAMDLCSLSQGASTSCVFASTEQECNTYSDYGCYWDWYLH